MGLCGSDSPVWYDSRLLELLCSRPWQRDAWQEAEGILLHAALPHGFRMLLCSSPHPWLCHQIALGKKANFWERPPAAAQIMQ